MLTTVKFSCTHGEFHDLHQRLTRVRSTSKTVTVDRTALAHCLIDYSRLVGFAQSHADIIRLEGDR